MLKMSLSESIGATAQLTVRYNYYLYSSSKIPDLTDGFHLTLNSRIKENSFEGSQTETGPPPKITFLYVIYF